MGNKVSSSKPIKHKHTVQFEQQNVLLIKASKESDHIVSRYQYDNKYLEFFENLRWKFNMLLLSRPFSCLSSITFLQRLTITELVFWLTCIGCSVYPIYWFVNTLFDHPIIEWNPSNVYQHHHDDHNDDDNQFGGPAAVCFTITWLLALRNTLWNLIFGLSFERAITFHKYCGRLSLFIGFIHFWEFRNYAWFKSDCLTGSITLGCAILIGLTSLKPFRRKMWTIFLKIHWLLFIAFLVFGLIHGASWLVVALSAWGLDIFYRIYLTFGKKVVIKDIKLLPCNVIRIEFDKKDFAFHAGQYVFLCVPAIDFTQFHPFSISSPPHHDECVMIHIRVLGDWTKKLYEFVAEKYKQQNDDVYEQIDWSELTVFIEGPYGELQIALHEYESIIMISGGIGITPLQSIFNELIHDNREDGNDLIDRIHFVWSVRDPSMMNEFGKIHWAGIQYKNYKQFDDKFNYKASSNSSYFYSPDLLLVQQGTKMVQKTKIMTQFYLTGVTNEQQKKQYLEENKLLKFGRPNIEKIIQKAKDEYQGASVEEEKVNDEQMPTGKSKGICILCCGPNEMVNDVKKYAAKHKIDCHVEVFDF
eukprot:332158_1